MEWDRGAKFSAILHAGFIFWALFGNWLFSPSQTPEVQVSTVDMVTEEEFQALMAAAPKPKEPTPEEPAPEQPAPQVEPPKPLDLSQPEPESAPEPAPEPEPTPEPLPETVPTSPDPQPVEAPEPVAPLAAEEQPIPVPVTSTKPKPRPSERVADVPVDEATDTEEIADTITPETSDQAAPDAPVVTEEQTEASPQEASTQIVTEATETDDTSPQLAPTTSRRPQSRPEKPVETAEEVPEEAPAEEPTPEASTEEDAIAAALAEAAATPDETGGADENLPEGPKMSASDIEGFRLAVKQCWNVGALSTEALNTTVKMRFEMQQNGKPDTGSFEITGIEGGSEAAARNVFETGRRAIILCAGPDGYDLPPEKFEDWRIVNVTFDPNGMRLR